MSACPSRMEVVKTLLMWRWERNAEKYSEAGFLKMNPCISVTETKKQHTSSLSLSSLSIPIQ